MPATEIAVDQNSQRCAFQVAPSGDRAVASRFLGGFPKGGRKLLNGLIRPLTDAAGLTFVAVQQVMRDMGVPLYMADYLGLSPPLAIVERSAANNDARPAVENTARHILKIVHGDHVEKLIAETIAKLDTLLAPIHGTYGHA